MGKEKKKTLKELRQELIETISLKTNEVKGMYIGSAEAQNGMTAVATAYNRVAEIDERKKENLINLGKAIAGAAGMLTETAMHERDMRTCLGLEQAYHSGATELKNIRKEFKPRRLLEK